MKKLMIVLACALSLGFGAAKANALTLSIGDAYYLGSINDGIPSSPAAEAAYINYLITLSAGQGDTQLPPGSGETYNRVGSALAGPFPTAVTLGSFKTTTEDPPNTIVLATGFTYILGKYDAARAGSLVWRIDGAGTEFTLPTTFNGLGLSHISAYNPTTTTVPDGGMTLALLGGALVGLGALRRKFSA